ncbi:hypothetical protein BCR44DRAFT_122977 [Catenaria anguillulae PL171]|uniref:RRM domain-containing protein n=1 Tax=Catenaria anguillulae PL171 TaxID=765915 RepID=A0A1Y2I6M2_9FUNG|nr:hypothetical protein BCR44DRAFT_122977 [Catenaria anguillulae PL171]
MDSSTYRGRDDRSRSPRTSSAKLDAIRDRNNNNNNRDDEEVSNPGNQLYVRGLSFRTTEPELRDLFGKYGELTEVNVVKDPHLNECRGFAFVKFANPEDAASAIKGEHDQDFHGRRLIVELVPILVMINLSRVATQQHTSCHLGGANPCQPVTAAFN